MPRGVLSGCPFLTKIMRHGIKTDKKITRHSTLETTDYVHILQNFMRQELLLGHFYATGYRV